LRIAALAGKKLRHDLASLFTGKGFTMVSDPVEGVEDHGIGIRVALRDKSLFQMSDKVAKRSTWNICGYEDVRTTVNWRGSFSQTVFQGCFQLSVPGSQRKAARLV